MFPLTALIRRTTSLLLCLLMLIPATLFDAAALAQQPTGTTFTSEANLVLVPVTVTDKSGQHIPNLTQADFTILDEGKPMKLASFEEVKQVPTRIQRPLEAGLYTNGIDQPDTAHGMTIILLDQVNTPFLDQATARQQLLKFFAERVSVNEPVALLALGRNGVRVIHDFTSSPKLLVAALTKVSSRSDTLTLEDTTVTPDVANREVTALDAFLAGTDGGYGAYQNTVAIENTLVALAHIAQGMEGIPGRKSLIWLTGAFPFEITSTGQLESLFYCTTGQTHDEVGGLAGGVGVNGTLPTLPESQATGDAFLGSMRPMWERTMQALNRSNIAVYPVDARGLLAYANVTISEARFKDVCGNDAQRHSTMNDIATITGGRAYYNTNDIAGAVGKAAGESQQYYLLGYYAEKSDKVKWHKLKVSVDKPGFDVRARVGYLSGGPTTKKPEEAINADIRAAITSPLDYTGIPVRLYLDPPQPAGDKRKVPFEVDVNGVTVDKANKNRVSLQIVVIARNQQGAAAQQFAQKIDLNLKDEQVPQVAAKGMNYNQALQLPPGYYQVHIIVRDNLANRVGSVVAPLQVN